MCVYQGIVTGIGIAFTNKFAINISNLLEGLTESSDTYRGDVTVIYMTGRHRKLKESGFGKEITCQPTWGHTADKYIDSGFSYYSEPTLISLTDRYENPADHTSMYPGDTSPEFMEMKQLVRDLTVGGYPERIMNLMSDRLKDLDKVTLTREEIVNDVIGRVREFLELVSDDLNGLIENMSIDEYVDALKTEIQRQGDVEDPEEKTCYVSEWIHMYYT
jgi:hypothetical protein